MVHPSTIMSVINRYEGFMIKIEIGDQNKMNHSESRQKKDTRIRSQIGKVKHELDIRYDLRLKAILDSS